ncbi:MAG: response regulator transcription factor [Flavobacteriales bacterium]|nr:response regulator transcription factor [Flavobacteriales bacterium]
MVEGALPVSVAVVDDHPLVRDLFADLIRTWPPGGLALLGGDGVDLEDQWAHTPSPNLALVDMTMPRRD